MILLLTFKGVTGKGYRCLFVSYLYNCIKFKLANLA